MALFKILDDRKRELIFGGPPKRVVSLMPCDTETLAALGCGGALVGCTEGCDPSADAAARLPRIGTMKNPDLDALSELAPDLIIANHEGNSRSDLEALAQKGFRIYVAFPRRVAEGIAHMAKLARIFDVQRDGVVRAQIKAGYEAVRAAEAAVKTETPIPAFCPIGMDFFATPSTPAMTVRTASAPFVSDMMALAGVPNVFAEAERETGHGTTLAGTAMAKATARESVTEGEIMAKAPRLVLLPDEPDEIHRFTEDESAYFRGLLARIEGAKGAVVPVSFKDLSWYGARSALALPRLRSLIAALPVER